jgi:hypothetical protein
MHFQRNYALKLIRLIFLIIISLMKCKIFIAFFVRIY